ncbi:PVC-type heme-binding CxxCH protein [Prosthecobacter sp.]|uniref:PVC-type heme-binding CxxCH protein n=1 Tax=Prosthecobacter sp. TaxID=1965333 RepID=UPI003784F769
MRILSFLPMLFLVGSAARLSAVEPVKAKINLLDVIKSGNVEYHVNPKADFHDDPKDIWTFDKDGTFHISGRGYGYVATKDNYRDYHLVLEFKWGTKTWGKREKAAKDNGLLLHAYGPHGAYGDTWMASIEAQIIEGGVGDILVLSPKLADGTELTTSLSSEYTLDRDKEKIWKKGEPRQTVTKGRINWKHRDVDWADKVGFRGREDVESPSGEWNRLEVIAKGDTLQYFVNGAMVNEAFDCKPSEGKILLQTEGAEMLVRRYELYPLGEFKEKWSAIQASGGSDIGAVRDGQDKALSPEESLKRIQLDGDYEAQLVAAEPLVLDPVECTWDAQGRMYVADMRDYPLGPPVAGDPWLSRIQLLTDEDGDGRMDKAVTFADHMDNVQGLLPYNGGLIATTRSQILFLKDTDGDGKADEIKSLIKGFNPKHAQLQVSAPRWGLDGCVHFNNGLDAREIYPADKPTDVVNIPGSNFKWDPRTDKITPTGGKGQYGGSFDDYGHHFYCSNRNPLMFTVMPYEAMLRNPHAGITQNFEDIAPFGPDTRVFPLQITHTTADAHAGTNTACSGLGVYRGPLMPELKNNVFVPDPTGQLVTRYKVEPNGASLKATRVGDRTEFFRSSDEWSRPVNFTTGPDGAIYICDIYRRWIDHARFFPEEFVKTHDMRQGENEGRIWRVVPKGKKAPKVEAAPKEIEKLVALLGNENAWQRETAQRLLVEMLAPKFAGSQISKFVCPLDVLEPAEAAKFWEAAHKLSGIGILHFFATYAGIDGGDHQLANTAQANIRDALTEKGSKDAPLTRLRARMLLIGRSKLPQEQSEKWVREGDAETAMTALLAATTSDPASAASLGKALLTRFPDDAWVARAVASSASKQMGRILSSLGDDYFKTFSETRSTTIRTFALGSLADAEAADVTALLTLLQKEPGKLLWWKPALLQGLAKLPKGHEDAAKEIAMLQSEIDEIIANPKSPLDQRLAVMPLLAQRKWDAVQPVVKTLLSTSQPPELALAALALLKKYPVATTAPFIYELLPAAGPALKRDLVPILTSNATTALALFRRMEKGEFPTAWVDVETRWRYQRGTGEMPELAKKLFGEASSDRAKVVQDYMVSTTMKGNAKRGQQVFATICISCHKHGALGVDVGPPLSDVKVKPPEGLLSDILDPNRMFEARWSAYTVETKDGRILSGLIQSETGDAIVLAMMGGAKETIQRSAIKEMKSLDHTLMPVGLEAAINKEQMADLLAFLLGK